MIAGYVRVQTAAQDRDRPIEVLRCAGAVRCHLQVDHADRANAGRRAA